MARYNIVAKADLNIVPGITAPVHIKWPQYNGNLTNLMEFTMYDGTSLWDIPEAITKVVISGAKMDGTGFSYYCTRSGSVVRAPLMRQMTIYAGAVPCNISFFDSSNNQVNSAAFVLDIEKAGLPSEVLESSNDFQTFVDYVDSARYYSQLSQSYAVGGTTMRTGENQDNSAYYAHLARMYKGSPLIAATASAMTDKSRVYVYVGSESGYTNGNWYYWTGTNWTSGGVYNAQGVQTDKLLITPDVAADAEATGKAITELQNANSDFLFALWHDFTTSIDEASGNGSVRSTRFFTSRDSINFTEVNKNIYPINTNTPTDPAGSVGAPSIRFYNGRFYLVTSSGTDTATKDGQIAVSEDLIHWTWFNFTLGLNRNASYTPNVFAPKLAVINDKLYLTEATDNGSTVVDIKGNTIRNSHCYIAEITSWNDNSGPVFSTPKLIQTWANSESNPLEKVFIDADIIQAKNGNIFMAIKNDAYKVIRIYTCGNSLDNEWTLVKDRVFWEYVEGCAIVEYAGVFHIYGDASQLEVGSPARMYHCITRDFVTFTDYSYIRSPHYLQTRHGSIICVDNDDAKKIIQALPDYNIGANYLDTPDFRDLVFSTGDIQMSADGNTRTMSSGVLVIAPDTSYVINLTRDFVIPNLINPCGVQSTRFYIQRQNVQCSILIQNVEGIEKNYTYSLGNIPTLPTFPFIVIEFRRIKDDTNELVPVVQYTAMQNNAKLVMQTGTITPGDNMENVESALRFSYASADASIRVKALANIPTGSVIATISPAPRVRHFMHGFISRNGQYILIPLIITTAGNVNLFGDSILNDGENLMLSLSYAPQN